MSEIVIVDLKPGDSRLSIIERMMIAMYGDLQKRGQVVHLAPGGEKTWRKGIESSLGKTSIILLAMYGDTPTGFAHGALRLQPSYLEGVKTGFISHVYVRPESRGKRVGYALVEGLEQWFREKGLATIELQVIIGNIEAHEFWKDRGYMDDLVQMRKAIAPCKA